MEKSTVRLQKYFTDCGVLSRRAAEAEIAAGRVTVNGEVATTGQPVTPGVDAVVWRGKRVVPHAATHRYVLLNKPRGFVTTMADEKGRPTVADLVKGVGTRVYPVGRLDMDSDGLLLLTDDGDLANRLTHPRHEISKLYHVTVKGAVSPEALQRLGQPFLLDGYETLPVTVTPLTVTPHATTLSFTLFEGRNRQIRRMCDQVGLHVRGLKRIAIGDIRLGTLKPGQWKYLSHEQIQYLKSI